MNKRFSKNRKNLFEDWPWSHSTIMAEAPVHLMIKTGRQKKEDKLFRGFDINNRLSRDAAPQMTTRCRLRSASTAEQVLPATRRFRRRRTAGMRHTLICITPIVDIPHKRSSPTRACYTRDHTVLPTNKIIRATGYVPLLHSGRILPPVGWYSFSVPLRVGG